MDSKRLAFAVAGAAGFIFVGLTSASASPYNDAVLASHPNYYWTFDEASGNAIDSVAGNSLVPNGSATRAVGTSTQSGISLGNTASFDGGGEFTIGDLSGTSTLATFAIEFWAKLGTDSAAYLMAFDVNNPAIINGYGGNGVELFSGDRTGSGASMALSDHTWHHVVVGSTGGTSHTFIIDNGTPLTFTTGAPIKSILQQALYIGGSNLGDVTTAQIDELAVYDLSGAKNFSAALSNIAAHYNVAATPEPTAAGLLGIAGIAALRRRRTA